MDVYAQALDDVLALLARLPDRELLALVRQMRAAPCPGDVVDLGAYRRTRRAAS